MSATYKGLTWDHPRGYNALVAAAAERAETDGVRIEWARQPLEGFESHPIADLCARYDLVVLDHPHVGEAVRGNCLKPIDEVFDDGFVHGLGGASIGPSCSSYAMDGHLWALPLDAATQVCVRRADLLPGRDAPKTWQDVLGIARDTGKVTMSLAGPHAFLSFLSIAAALGLDRDDRAIDAVVGSASGREAFGLMSELAALAPRSTRDLNPIGILDHMSVNDDVALCPLVYGYVNYSAPGRARPLAFSDAPRAREGGRIGSTLGGTGIAISRRCSVSPGLRRHLEWLLGAEAQAAFIPAHEGQPSSRQAWSDTRVNADWGGFYENTAATIEDAHVRPRHDGYIAFQTAASALLRDALEARRAAAPVVAEVNALFAKSVPVSVFGEASRRD